MLCNWYKYAMHMLEKDLTFNFWYVWLKSAQMKLDVRGNRATAQVACCTTNTKIHVVHLIYVCMQREVGAQKKDRIFFPFNAPLRYWSEKDRWIIIYELKPNFINRSEVNSTIRIDLQGQNALNCTDRHLNLVYFFFMRCKSKHFAYIQFDPWISIDMCGNWAA